MSYEVLAADLIKASGEFDTVAAGVVAYDLPVTGVEPATLGHIELAAWLVAVEEQADKAGVALFEGSASLSASLETAAVHYGATDAQVAESFTPIDLCRVED